MGEKGRSGLLHLKYPRDTQFFPFDLWNDPDKGKNNSVHLLQIVDWSIVYQIYNSLISCYC